MNPQHIPQNMQYINLLAEEGLKVVNSHQAATLTNPEFQPQIAGQQAYMQPYPVQGDGYHHDRMLAVSMGGRDETGIPMYDDSRGGIMQFNPTHFQGPHAPFMSADQKSGHRSKKKNSGARAKKRSRDPSSWKRNLAKIMRSKGQGYINANGKVRPPRIMKEPCRNCRQRCTERISEEQRRDLFEDYWDQNKDWMQRRLFVTENVVPMAIKQRRMSQTPTTNRVRRLSFHYYLPVNNEKMKVCKTFFLNTLAVGDKFVTISLRKKSVNGTMLPDQRGRHTAHNKTPKHVKEDVKCHIQTFLSSQQGNIQDGQMNVAKMYGEYLQECEMQGKSPVKKHVYRKLVTEELNPVRPQPDGNTAPSDQIESVASVSLEAESRVNLSKSIHQTSNDDCNEPDSHVSALDCLIKELQQKELERVRKPRSQWKLKLKEYHSLRFAGKEYVNFKGEVRPPRKMKEACQNCRKACSERITESQREQLFSNFWDPSKDWNEKRKYVVSCIQSEPVMERRLRRRCSTSETGRRKNFRFSYSFIVDGKTESICRKFFVNTLGLSNNFVAACLEKRDQSGKFSANVKKGYRAVAKMPSGLANEIKRHIIYHCWADPNKARDFQSHSSKSGWSWNVSKMYAGYRQVCEAKRRKPGSEYMYRRVFSEEMKIYKEVHDPSAVETCVRSPNRDTALSSSDSDTSVSDGDDGDKGTVESDVDGTQDSDDGDVSSDEEAEEHLSYEEGNGSDEEEEVEEEVNAQTLAEHNLRKSRKSKRSASQHLRCGGQAYVNSKGQVIPARKLREPCQNCRKRCTDRVSEEMRQKLFSMFWNQDMKWDEKRRYVAECIEEHPVHRRAGKSRRQVYLTYKLKLDEWEEGVCKTFFLNTLGIGQQFTRMCMQKKGTKTKASHQAGEQPQVGSSPSNEQRTEVTEEDIKAIKEHISSFPAQTTVDKTTNKPHPSQKRYLGGNLDLTQMYELYCRWCRETDRNRVGQSVYSTVFYQDFNLGFEIPACETVVLEKHKELLDFLSEIPLS